MKSFLLNNNWDLKLDGLGDIAITTDIHYEYAQSVANAARTFLGEVYFQTNIGVPYQNILGKQIPLSYLTTQLQQAALSVTGVEDAKCIIDDVSRRKVSGRIIFIDTTGAENNVNF